jgi:hypothetical protein
MGEELETNSEMIYQNELLSTIYFPKKVKNIGYLTDKLPKAKYEELGSSKERAKKNSSD